jgi:MarR family transcriptional regulator, organic hydroperoxide resistance regulator
MPDRKKTSRRPLPVVSDGDPRGLELQVWVTFVRVYHRLEHRLMAGLEGHGLSLPQFDVLATLFHGEGITQQELARRLLVTKGNVVGLIDRLSAAGWVERRPDPDDRRANRLHLTAAGRRLLSKALPCHFEAVREALGALSQGELTTLRGLLDRLDDAVED